MVEERGFTHPARTIDHDHLSRRNEFLQTRKLGLWDIIHIHNDCNYIKSVNLSIEIMYISVGHSRGMCISVPESSILAGWPVKLQSVTPIFRSSSTDPGPVSGTDVNPNTIIYRQTALMVYRFRDQDPGSRRRLKKSCSRAVDSSSLTPDTTSTL
jgi:hypothetical protein